VEHGLSIASDSMKPKMTHMTKITKIAILTKSTALPFLFFELLLVGVWKLLFELILHCFAIKE
jgi:hypothetical protein